MKYVIKIIDVKFKRNIVKTHCKASVNQNKRLVNKKLA